MNEPGYAPRRGTDDDRLNRPMGRPRHGFGPRRGEDVPLGRTTPSGKFGRMFPDLLPLVPAPEQLIELSAEMRDADPGAASGNNDAVPAGFTYLGQFIDHDITFDPTALQEVIVDPQALENFRTPMLDLDCLYGAGPAAAPFLYERGDNERLLVGRTSSTPGQGDPSIPTERPNDLPRAPHGFALIGDPRNDENLVVAQTHLALLKFHNKIVDGLRGGTIPRVSPLRKSTFDEARDLVISHYQWIVIHDFLKRVLDEDVWKTVFTKGEHRGLPCFERGPFIPVEFSAAAYRFGHTMVREVYAFNRVFRPGGVAPATLELLFLFSGLSGPGNTVPIPSDWIIDWRNFFEVGKAKPNASRSLDPLLAPKLHQLPGMPDPASLAARNLLRGRSLGLPSAQSIARFLDIEPLTPDEIAQGPDGAIAARHNLHVETPLWYYILKEAQIDGKGKRVGTLGSIIVAETFFALLRADSSSFLRRKQGWTPTLPSAKADTFTMADLLRFVDDINPIGDAA